MPVYALGSYDDGRPYYAMRFVRGASLQAAIDRHHHAARSGANSHPPSSEHAQDPRTLNQRQLLQRFSGACEAVAYAHSRGVLHRDIKPDNIMLGNYGETLVVDWGLAKVLGAAPSDAADAGGGAVPCVAAVEPTLRDSGATPTRQGSTLGTPGFMSPEQARGEVDQLGPTSDVYSLGATLYCVLTGKPAISSGDLGVQLQQTIAGQFAKPRQIKAEIPRPLESVCLKAMALQPAQRYATARDLAADIERFLADEPVSAHADSAGERASRWMRRHRAAVMAGVVALLLIAGVSSFSAVIIAQSRTRAVTLAQRNAALAEAEAQARQEAELKKKAADDATANALDQQARAERYYQLSIDTVDRFLTETIEDERLLERGLETLRRDLIGQVRDFYELVIEGAAEDQDPLYLRRANAHLRLGDIHYELGEHAEAIEAYRKATEYYASLGPEDARVESYAAALNNLAMAVQASGNLDLAVMLRRELLNMTTKLLNVEPENGGFLAAHAMAQLNLALLLTSRSPAESVEIAEQAKQTLQRALTLAPDNADHRATLALVHNNLANTFIQMEKFDQAAIEIQAAEEIWRPMAHEASGIRAEELNDRLALLMLNQAAVLASRNDFTSANAVITEALAVREELAARHPDKEEYQSMLADLHQSAGLVYREMTYLKEAVAEFHAAMRILAALRQRHPETPAHRLSIASCQTDLGVTRYFLGDLPGATQAIAAALDEATALVRDNPQQVEHRLASSRAHYFLGLIYLESMSRLPDAVKQLTAAAEGFDSLRPECGQDTEFLCQLADCQVKLGSVFGPLMLADPVQAAAWNEQAKASANAILAEPLRSLAPPSHLLEAYQVRATANSGLKQYPEALRDWDEARTRLGGEWDFSTAAGKAITLYYMGRYDDALQVARAATPALQTGALAFALARETALGGAMLAEAELSPQEMARLTAEFYATALQLLRRAQSLGFFETADAVEFLQNDEYFAGIRSRPEFEAFVKEVKH